MAPTTRQQASTPANNAQNTTQSSPVFEPPEPTSSPPHEDDSPMTRRDVMAMIHHSNEDLIRRMNTTLEEAFRRFNLPPRESEPIGHTPTPEPPVEPPYQPISTTSIQPIQTPISATTPIPHTRTEAIKPKDIGYFDPKPYAESTVSDSENGPTIHDVFLFVNRLKEIANRTNKAIPVELSLRGTAMEWFHSELSPSERSKLHTISMWSEALTRRFGPTTAEAMTAISNEHYTRNDAANRREPAGYIQAIIRHGKAAALPTSSVLAIAYQNVDPELRRDLNDPTESSVSSFVKDMEAKKPIWFDLYARRHYTPYPTNQAPRFRPPNPPYNHPSTTSNQPRNQPPYQYGRYQPHESWNRHTYQAPATIQNGPVDKPRAYNTTTDDADDADEAYEAYYYDPPNDAYKSVAKCPRCRFHFDTYDKLIEHMQREGHKA